MVDDRWERTVNNFDFRSASFGVRVIAVPIIVTMILIVWITATLVMVPISAINSIIAGVWVCMRIARRNLWTSE
jgi:hypothetical protein